MGTKKACPGANNLLYWWSVENLKFTDFWTILSPREVMIQQLVKKIQSAGIGLCKEDACRVLSPLK